MPKPMIRIHNTETNEIVDREMNEQEFTAYQALVANFENEQEEIRAKAQSKQAILERLGLSQDEAKLLLS